MDASTHSAVLSDSLQRLKLSQETIAEGSGESSHSPDSGRTAHLEGYGFRSASGLSTPFTAISAPERDSPIPDPNGLGWPGDNIPG